ncbi:uncharacterized protein LOC119722545 [Patiria miniata]|uniref:G-protein coupled receptors family 2 profile 2 domain-containing protein n=1 Tax=Patiria miniata TaxID=46514 RepID=A0A913ZC87_PATMI|nr:uncharacterized protein LOC119722545 [Patiria miniata]
MSQKLLTFPVTGPDEIVFKNVFCTICHHIPVYQLVPWSIRLWDCKDSYSMASCFEFKLYPPPSLSSDLHLCYTDIVDTCPPNTTESQSTFCQNHTSLVFDIEGGPAYKNVYCSHCHGLSHRNLKCKLFGQNRLDPQFSILLLFDFTERRVVSDISGESLGDCSQWQIYDPFQDGCRNLSCPVGMTIQSGRCVEALLPRSAWTDGITGDCFQQLLSSGGIANYTRDNFTTLVKVSQQSGVMSEQYYVRQHFSVAKRVQDALNSFADDVSTSYPCNSTRLILVVSSQANTKSKFPICQGFTLHGVQLGDIDLNNDLYVTKDGHEYSGLDFMHVTVYEFVSGNGSSSKETYLRLCDPFVDKKCPVLSFNRSEFLVEKADDDDDVFAHKASGQTFQADDVWQLPDGSLRVCNFLSPITPDNYPAWMTTLSDFSFAGSGLSLVCLILAFATYVVFPAVRNQPGKIIMNLMVALILAQVSLMIGKMSTHWLCVLRATSLHFSWLATFSWMSVLATDLALNIQSKTVPRRRDESNNSKVLKLGLVAWGLPAVFVSVCFLVSKMGPHQSRVWLEYGGSSCWIADPLHSLFVFGIPVAVLLTVNCVLLAYMIYAVLSNRKRLVALQMARSARNDLLLCSKLVMVTGATWSLLFAANVAKSAEFWYVAVLVNSLQGALIGLMFLLKGSVRRLWQEKLQNYWSKHCVCCRSRKPGESSRPTSATSRDQPATSSGRRLRSNIVVPLNVHDQVNGNVDLLASSTNPGNRD